MIWFQEKRRWGFRKDKKIIRLAECDLDEADKIGMEMYRRGICDDWTPMNADDPFIKNLDSFMATVKAIEDAQQHLRLSMLHLDGMLNQCRSAMVQMEEAKKANE